jgi:hypothetical protein
MPLPKLFNKKATIPMSLEHWYQNPTLATELRELLNKEVFKVAIATLTQANTPTGMPQNKIGSAEERLAWLAGYNDLARDLVQLTKPRAEFQELIPWGYVKPTEI